MADSILTRKAFRYRIYPTRAQQTKLQHTLDLCRETYNAALQERRDAYRRAGHSVTYREQADQLSELKELRPDLNDLHSQVLQDVLTRLEKGFQAFFRRVKNGEDPGYPRFRGRDRYNSFTYPQSGFGLEAGKRTKKSRSLLRLSKIGHLKIKLHRPIKGQVKTLTIIRSSTGKWFASFSAEVVLEPLADGQGSLRPFSSAAIGIDVGLKSFAALSDGTEIENPGFFRAEEKELAKVQRKLSQAPKRRPANKEDRGRLLPSVHVPSRASRRKAVARVHERIANRRKNFAHQLSAYLVLSFGLIVFEDLNIKGMVRNHCLAKSIADAAWNQLVKLTIFKAACAGRKVILVDPRNTSQRCSGCGEMVAKTLAERIHECSHCGLYLKRDHNAAINILSLGLQRVG